MSNLIITLVTFARDHGGSCDDSCQTDSDLIKLNQTKLNLNLNIKTLRIVHLVSPILQDGWSAHAAIHGEYWLSLLCLFQRGAERWCYPPKVYHVSYGSVLWTRYVIYHSLRSHPTWKSSSLPKGKDSATRSMNYLLSNHCHSRRKTGQNTKSSVRRRTKQKTKILPNQLYCFLWPMTHRMICRCST